MWLAVKTSKEISKSFIPIPIAGNLVHFFTSISKQNSNDISSQDTDYIN